MAEMSEIYGESANNTKIEIEQHLEESLISQADYEKLKQENERYRQELHVLRFKLTAHEAAERDHQESYEALEKKFKHLTMTEKEQKDLIDRYTAEKEEYETQIFDLEKDIEEYCREISKYQIEQNKYTNHQSNNYQSSIEEILQYKEDIQKLRNLLCDKDKNIEELKDRLANMEDTCRINQELSDNLHITREELARKEKELKKAVETAKELSTNLRELELSKVTPASDTCKGNSLFAEVEDRRRMILDKMKLYLAKFNNIKQLLNTKIAVIKILQAEKNAMIKKWETDVIDTSQENEDLLNEYKRRISELENKLKFQIIKSNQAEEAQFTDDFHYARSLITAKGKEIEQLNEKIVKQAVQILVQEETNHSISKELRYWQSKAMYLETENLTIKTQLEKEQLEDIENCKISDDENFEKILDHSQLIPDKVPEVNTYQRGSTEMSKKPIMDSTKKCSKIVCFTENPEDSKDIKDTGSKSLKKKEKQCDYPIVSYTEDDMKMI